MFWYWAVEVVLAYVSSQLPEKQEAVWLLQAWPMSTVASQLSGAAQLLETQSRPSDGHVTIETVPSHTSFYCSQHLARINSARRLLLSVFSKMEVLHYVQICSQTISLLMYMKSCRFLISQSRMSVLLDFLPWWDWFKQQVNTVLPQPVYGYTTLCL